MSVTVIEENSKRNGVERKEGNTPKTRVKPTPVKLSENQGDTPH